MFGADVVKLRGSRPIGGDSVVVVGAGLAGLSAALHLAGAGRDVTVVERAGAPGGRAARVIRPATGGGDYHLDTGPTVLTMPDLVADCFAAVGQEMTDWLTLKPVDPAYRAEFADGSGISMTTDFTAMSQRIAELSGPGEAAAYGRYVEFVTRLYRLQMRDFIDRNFDSPTDLVGLSLARLAAMGGFARLAPTLRRYFADERLQRIFGFQALYAGLSPERALAIYAVIAYMDLVEGVYYPEGGMNALPTAMEAAARSAGVKFSYDADITGVRWNGDRVRAVRAADGQEWAADAVVVTVDHPAAWRILDRPDPRARGPLRTRFSPSCVVLAAGLAQDLPPDEHPAHHTMHFGRGWGTVFDDLEQGRPMRDPSFLVSRPTVTDPGLAPPGGGTAYVLFPAPNLTGAGGSIDWTRLRGPYREHMLRSVEKAGLAGFGDTIDAEVLTTPADWAAQGLGAGTPFAAAHTFAQTGPFRTANTVGANVALAGSSTVPGVGVPMVLISGRLAAERVVGADPAYRSRAWR